MFKITEKDLVAHWPDWPVTIKPKCFLIHRKFFTFFCVRSLFVCLFCGLTVKMESSRVDGEKISVVS